MAILSVCAFGASGQEPFRRAIDTDVFIPKGQWITGLSVNYSQSRQNDYQFLIVENINGNTYNFKLGPMFCYAFKDDLAAGARFQYSRNRVKLDGAKAVIDSETGFEVENLYSITQSYNTQGILRYYIGLGKSKRFAIFNEAQIKVGISESKLAGGNNEKFSGTYAKTTTIGVGLAPGAMMFLSNYSALEVSLGVLGVNFNRTKQIKDQIYDGHFNSTTANFKIDLFSISFGMVFYL